jgi:AraC-like DNA-binding protein
VDLAAPLTGRIRAEERSGVLRPGNLVRYDAHWIPPSADVADVVDTYWHVSWALRDGERLDQRIIDLPSVTLSVEDGDVPAPFVVTGVQAGAWRRTIRGRGRVFAIRLRPAGLAVLGDLVPAAVADATVALDARGDPRLFALLRRVAARDDPVSRAREADDVIRARLAERPPASSGLLANAVLDELRARLRTRTGSDLAARFGVSDRTVQRALATTVGHGPKWVARRLRLQDVAQALATRPGLDLAVLATDLGYSDQSHLTADFRTVAGVTPDRYRRELVRLADT